MNDFGVELNPVDLFLYAAVDGNGAAFGAGEHFEPFGHSRHVVGMAHPAHARGGHALGERAFLDEGKRPLAVFARFRVFHFSAQRIGDQLTSVADAEHGNPQMQNFRGNVGRIFVVNAVGAARKDDPDGIVRSDLFRRHVAGFEIAIDAQIAHAARDQLIVLSAEVKYQNFLMFHVFSSMKNARKRRFFLF